jgi:hypothetical protein
MEPESVIISEKHVGTLGQREIRIDPKETLLAKRFQ